ncbi:MAG: hypothetical protein R3332_05360 [Pseudohongiellaceae bacterium]|nr:hypothetical protein [Pseudohongiellaceae bacterium]
MERLVGIFQIMFAGVFIAMALATLVNLGFILMRPETVSVVNSIIGQGVLIICMTAISRILFRKGNKRIHPETEQDAS